MVAGKCVDTVHLLQGHHQTLARWVDWRYRGVMTSSPRPKPRNLVFCLGGRDLEMETIAALVRETLGDEHVVDREPGWGATADLYADDIAAIVAAGRVPVLVELPTGARPLPDRCLSIDHHGPHAGATAPTALEQAFALLGLPEDRWTRHLALVAANDRGHVAEMRAYGATPDEIAAIRAADRRAQGITDAEEAAAETALAAAQRRADGRLLIVRLPHGRTAPVMDRLALNDGAGPAQVTPSAPDAVIVLSPDEANVFGPGAVITALDSAFPGGWSGGALPSQGFWGIAPAPDQASIRSVVEAALPP